MELKFNLTKANIFEEFKFIFYFQSTKLFISNLYIFLYTNFRWEISNIYLKNKKK